MAFEIINLLIFEISIYRDSFYWYQVTVADLTSMQLQQSVCGPATCCTCAHAYL